MRPNPLFASEDPEIVRELIRRNPWATLVSDGPDGLVASHYPVLLDEASPGIAILTHVGRPDDELHGFGSGRELLVIIQGRHGYISPSWYPKDGPAIRCRRGTSPSRTATACPRSSGRRRTWRRWRG